MPGLIDRLRRRLVERVADENLPDGGMGLSSPFLVAPRVLTLQKKLRAHGFDVELNSTYDEQTAMAVAEIKRRLRILIPLDTEDRATPELLGRLGL